MSWCAHTGSSSSTFVTVSPCVTLCFLMHTHLHYVLLHTDVPTWQNDFVWPWCHAIMLNSISVVVFFNHISKALMSLSLFYCQTATSRTFKQLHQNFDIINKEHTLLIYAGHAIFPITCNLKRKHYFSKISNESSARVGIGVSKKTNLK